MQKTLYNISREGQVPPLAHACGRAAMRAHPICRNRTCQVLAKHN